MCRFRATYLPIHDRRRRQIDTLFGRVTVEVPRVRMCMCGLPGFPQFRAAYSPLTRLLPGNATPELRRLQAEPGARHSFREAARLLNMLTPCAKQNHMTIRNRLASVADGLECRCNQTSTDTSVTKAASVLSVFLDSAYVRSRPEYHRRNFELIAGAIEDPTGRKRRFGLSLAGTDYPLGCLRTNLKAAGWREGTRVTVRSDGDPTLHRLVRNATGADVDHVLDWWHISIRIRHVETTCQTLLSDLDTSEAYEIDALVKNLRWWIWRGQTERALEALETLLGFGMRVRETSIGGRRGAGISVVARVMELSTYLNYNNSAGFRRVSLARRICCLNDTVTVFLLGVVSVPGRLRRLPMVSFRLFAGPARVWRWCGGPCGRSAAGVSAVLRPICCPVFRRVAPGGRSRVSGPCAGPRFRAQVPGLPVRAARSGLARLPIHSIATLTGGG